jgi:hypothetical protein
MGRLVHTRLGSSYLKTRVLQYPPSPVLLWRIYHVPCVIGPGSRSHKTSPHKTRLVISHSTCPPLSSSSHAHIFVIGTIVLNIISSPPPRAEFCDRSCSNKHHLTVNIIILSCLLGYVEIGCSLRAYTGAFRSLIVGVGLRLPVPRLVLRKKARSTSS